MADTLGGIDVSHLDALAKLEADQRGVRALIDKAAWHRDKVVDVYTRVVRDYEARHKALDEQAQVVRQRVREDLAALDALHEQCGEAVEQARVELQESEFRHEIGEFSRDEFQKRQQAIERTIAEREEQFQSVKTLRQRYLDLLPAGARTPAAPLAAPPPVAKAAPPAPPAVASSSTLAPPPAVVMASLPVTAIPVSAPVAATLVPGTSHGGAAVPPPVPAPAVPSFEDPIAPADATGFLAPPSGTDFQVPPVPGSSDASQFGTEAGAVAMLVEDESGLPGIQHRLGTATTIGRTTDNQIVVPVREVSRRHAEIILTEDGYTIKDLGSPNGTFVNGERITEQRLEDGDRIAMGGQVFV